jgi:hypothetical protein
LNVPWYHGGDSVLNDHLTMKSMVEVKHVVAEACKGEDVVYFCRKLEGSDLHVTRTSLCTCWAE